MKGNIKNIIDTFFVIDESSTNITNVSLTRRALVLAGNIERNLQNYNETVINAINLSSD